MAGSAASYAFHVRHHYEEIDSALAVSARRTAQALAAGHGLLGVGESGLVTVVRLYGPDGELQRAWPPGETAPPLRPQAVLADPSGPAYGFVPSLAPSVVPVDPGPGSFGLLRDERQRWRAFVLPVGGPGAEPGYVVTLAPLGELDGSMSAFASLLTGVGLAGLLSAVAGSWLVVRSALRPIAVLTETARAITASRDLSRRVRESGRDEVGRLAETFNQMLAALESAYRAQLRFVADASHELRAPLTVILGNLELLRRRPDLRDEERQEALAEAQREAERLTRLVADLLALARADAGLPLPRRPVDLDSVVLEAFREARALARGHEMTLDPFEPVRVAGDADRLKQLLLILLDNALKYTPSSGRVTVGLRAADGRAEITVRDTGIGIPPEDLPHVFERFYRADPARSRDPGGTGLGLPIARWIVEQHGGEIELHSERGRGTTVVVRLPRLA